MEIKKEDLMIKGLCSNYIKEQYELTNKWVMEAEYMKFIDDLKKIDRDRAESLVNNKNHKIIWFLNYLLNNGKEQINITNKAKLMSALRKNNKKAIAGEHGCGDDESDNNNSTEIHDAEPIHQRLSQSIINITIIIIRLLRIISVKIGYATLVTLILYCTNMSIHMGINNSIYILMKDIIQII